MMVLVLSLVAAGGVYAYVRHAGWQLDNEDVVGAAPVPAGCAAGVVYAFGTLLPGLTVGGVPSRVLLQFAAGCVGVAASSALGLVVLEGFIDAERDDDRFEPRLLTRRE